MSIPERREAVAELSRDGLSQRQIADVLGVNQATVHRDSIDANASNNRDPERDDDANASNTMPNDTPTLAMVDLETGEIVTDKAHVG
jgi:IS30 family transposase